MTLDEAIAHAKEKAEQEGECGEEHLQLYQWLKELRVRRQDPTMDRIAEALNFYGNPETYHACSFFFDPPTGGFDDDFGEPEEHGHPFYDRPMPGKLARATIHFLVEGESDA